MDGIDQYIFRIKYLLIFADQLNLYYRVLFTVDYNHYEINEPAKFYFKSMLAMVD